MWTRCLERKEHKKKWSWIRTEHPQFFVKYWSDRPEGKHEAKEYLKARFEPILQENQS